MPVKPPRACLVPGCSDPAVEHGRCVGHQDQAPAPQTPAEVLRDRPWHALYNTARWKHPSTGLRAAVLRHDPICTECHRNPSTIADHKRDHKGDPNLFYDFNNLRGLCKPCHDKKTGETQGGTLPAKKPALEGGLVCDYGEDEARKCPHCGVFRELCTCAKK